MPFGPSAFPSISGLVFGVGLANARSAFRTKGGAHPARSHVRRPFYTWLVHSNGRASNDAESQSRNRATAPPPSGRTHNIAPQRNANASTDGQSPAGPVTYPRIYARSVCPLLSVCYILSSPH